MEAKNKHYPKEFKKQIVELYEAGKSVIDQDLRIWLGRTDNLHSYSKKGYPYDNSCIESSHSVLRFINC